MEMNTTKAGTYQVRWLSPEGKRGSKTFKTRAQARDFTLSMQAAKRSGDYVDPKLADKNTVATLYAEWMAWLVDPSRRQRTAGAKTIDNYRRMYENYVLPRWGYTPLGRVSYNAVDEWISGLRGVDDSPAGAATKRAVALLFGRLMNFAVKRGYLAQNPAKDRAGEADYVPAMNRKVEHAILSMSQLELLADKVSEVAAEQQVPDSVAGDMGLLVLLTGTCGLRWGEVSALRVEDMSKDAKGRTFLTIDKAWSEVGGKLVNGRVVTLPNGKVRYTTKNGLARTAAIPMPVATKLWSMVEGKAGHDLMFCGGRGGALRNSNFTRRFYTAGIKRAQAADGTFPTPTFHDLRHTAVSLAIGSGASIAMVAEIVGHHDADFTLKTYTKVTLDEQNDVAEGLARMMQATGAS